MALARFDGTAIIDDGTFLQIAPSASIEVRKSSDGNKATIYSDSAGSTELANPFTADSNGRFGFYVQEMYGGFNVKVTATTGETYTRSNIPIERTFQTLIRDDDNDTKVQVEESSDEDTIRFDIAGAERGDWNATRIRIQDIMEIQSDDNTLSALHFGDPEDNDVGRVTYDHSDNAMRFYQSGALEGRWDATGLGIGGNDVVPDGPLHIGAGLAGSVTANSSADEFIIEGSAGTGMSILAPDGSDRDLRFLSPTNGGFRFTHTSSNRLDAVLGANFVFEIRSDLIDFNFGGASYDFRIRGQNDAQLFYVDTSNDNIGLNSNSPDTSALLDMVSTTKGLGLPSMTTTQRDNISTPRDGVLIYNSTTNKMNIRANGAWEEVTSS